MGTKWFCCFNSPKASKWKKKNKYTTDHNKGSPGEHLCTTTKNLFVISYDELKAATRNFHQTNRIGRGGFGVVYKGMLKDGTQVAVKSLSEESKQGINEFLTEIDTVSNAKHPNLVRLIGCCVEGRNRMLVYEYLENNSLANALLGPKNMHITLDWTRRAGICIGTANGLLYLHDEAEPHIVHRDIKASNILLDKDLIPKIGDFGLAKLFPDTVTHISTRVAGTMGYLAPEYALLGHLTKKADIYSFGVLVLEVVSGRSSSKSVWGHDMKDLLEWVTTFASQTWKLREEDRLLEIVDPELESYPKEEVLRFIKVALFCTQAASHQRPSMNQVVDMLLQSDGTSLDVSSLTQPRVVRKPVDPSGNAEISTRNKGYQASTSTYDFITSRKDVNSTPNSMTEIQPR